MTNTSLRSNILAGYTDKQIFMVEEHLKRRFKARKAKPSLGIVFDILYECNLQCRGCSVSPHFNNTESPLPLHQLVPTTGQVEKILNKIYTYASTYKKSCFVNFGGGEPFLRPDFEQIVKLASQYFGPSGVGIDSNGTVDGEFERIVELVPYFSYLGISLDGLEEYHNWWRNGQIRGGAFQKSIALIKSLVLNSTVGSKLEVSSVASKRNLEQLPLLMKYLKDLGVNSYSVHRAMPVGRMELFPELVPNSKEYFGLLVKLLEAAEELSMSVHLHHSIESIYATLLLGLETYQPDLIGTPDAGASLGIEPGGTLVFDPWSMLGAWKQLNGGNLLDDGMLLADILETRGNTVLDLARVYTAPNIRCRGCVYPCSGGNRIAAAAGNLVVSYGRLRQQEITVSHILSAMQEIDPACPLYEQQN